MWIVRLALNRPYTFIVAAILILLLGVFSVARMPTDIFPVIDIPVVSIIWTYQGLPTPEMEKRVTTFSEFVLALVNDVKSIESQTLNGVSVVKIYFHPTVRIDAAMAQVTSAVQGIRFRMPPGINPPWILRFGADTVPVIQLSLSSKTLSEAALYDYGIFRVRQQLSTVPGTLLARALRWKGAPDHGRHRPEPASFEGTDFHRYRECHQFAEPDAAQRLAKNRQP
ncbi:MAG: Cation efflux system protein CusA [Bryobacterales bacterium]|nr:Cation efflux system protein CusA [Bryobacterales bacterium]